jgi:dihydrofolate synthase/folylpolyglutamate synthase
VDFAGATRFVESAARFGIHPSLDGIRALTAALDRPQDSLRFCQIGGTNGKTSVTRLIGSILQGHGQSAGVYTSPRLASYAEQIEVDGLPIDGRRFAAVVGRVADAARTLPGEPPTEFELTTAAALVAFDEARVDWACLEVGLGGRWDATSIVEPEVSVVTGIGVDHVDQLGSDPAGIARDKATIIKPGSVAVLGPRCEAYLDVFRSRASETGATLVRVTPEGAGGDVTFRLLETPHEPGGVTIFDVRGRFGSYEGLRLRAPSYQAGNAAVAIAAAESALSGRLDADALREVLSGARFPGRFEVLRLDPPLIVDGSHNPQAAEVLAEAVREAFGQSKPVFVIAVLADKDVEGIVGALAPVSSGFVCTATSSPRALEAGRLAEIVERVTGRECITEASVGDAIRAAMERGPTGVVVTGTLTIVEPARIATREGSSDHG